MCIRDLDKFNFIGWFGFRLENYFYYNCPKLYCSLQKWSTKNHLTKIQSKSLIHFLFSEKSLKERKIEAKNIFICILNWEMKVVWNFHENILILWHPCNSFPPSRTQSYLYSWGVGVGQDGALVTLGREI